MNPFTTFRKKQRLIALSFLPAIAVPEASASYSSIYAFPALRNFVKKLSVLLVFYAGSGYAQSFDYTVAIDSSQAYTSLSSATVLSPGQKWLPTYEIPTGFSDPSSQQITLETNGFVVYNKQFNSAIMAFNGFRCKLDSNSAWSQLSYLSTGSPGSKILKIEFKNVGQGAETKELLSYQVWIRENGVFEIAIGPNTYEKLPGDTIIDTNQVVHLGLINRNMDTANQGLFVSGSPQNPAPAALNSGDPALAYLRTVPKRGYKYIFTPN
ncbi:MAG: hypothetical protein K0S33_3760 [Bacteroidetes bacterium]|jgi:hypothetical protein|nr:hypothetical protein [Bacteroidota bacterium]